MKHIKTFEKINDDPHVDDYVIIKVLNNACAKNAISFIESHIGQIKKNKTDSVYYTIVFDQHYNYTNSLGHKETSNGYFAKRNEILEFSPNKKEIELKMSANKYNL